VDEGSTDGTRAACERFGNKIRYFYQENRGVSSARNRGIAEVRGKYVAFLDVDDWYLPEKLSRQVAWMEAHPTAGAVGSPHWLKDAKGERLSFDMRRTMPPDQEEGWMPQFFECYAKGWTLFSPGDVLICREVLQTVGAFNPHFHFGEDHELWMRIGGRYAWGCLRQALSVYNRTSEVSVLLHASLEQEALGSFATLYDQKALQNYLPKSEDQRCLGKLAQYRPGKSATSLRRLMVSTRIR
jgi:glycosyltransferase involved in cell wall biosynthesis